MKNGPATVVAGLVAESSVLARRDPAADLCRFPIVGSSSLSTKLGVMPCRLRSGHNDLLSFEEILSVGRDNLFCRSWRMRSDQESQLAQLFVFTTVVGVAVVGDAAKEDQPSSWSHGWHAMVIPWVVPCIFDVSVPIVFVVSALQ